MALLEVENLRVELATARGPAAAVRGLDFSLERGETLGIVGESGCGKSMTALALMGLLPDGAKLSGRIAFQGRDLVGLPEAELCKLRGNRISMIFQEPMTSLNPLQRIGEQIAEPLLLHEGLTRAAAQERVLGLLDRVGLPNPRQRIDAYPHQLSGGQRQRVMIAMALACNPDILVADEPTTALDVTIQGQILDLIDELVAERGMALILISHDLGVIAESVRRVLVMYAGIAAEQGPVHEVFAAMAHPYARGLFAAMPRLGRGAGLLPTIPGIVPDLHELGAGCPFAPRCALADQTCRAQMPPPVPIGPGHVAACWHPGEAAP
ncbi:ABC transporter ATP-binding protein [Ferrovibrio sp. MS7]|uniref:ABC transporter ATP-binding protein n=1 Tax=Ferrovibrio plantarum TaxID=3119164 RepID=UPI003135235A